MLEFNPKKRLTAEDLLKSSLFDEFRKPELEKGSPVKIRAGIDRMRDFDYAKKKFKKLSKIDLKKILTLEINKFKLGPQEEKAE